MKSVSIFLILLIGALCEDSRTKTITVKKYDPTWQSLDTRPIPTWFDEAKIGIFIHWGVFSVPSFGSEWFWQDWRGVSNPKFVAYMKNNYPPNFTYQEFAKDFTAEFFNPDDWADLFQKSGAKYVVLTSKHHEGFTLWPSKYSFGWNAMDIGPHRDLIKSLSDAVLKTDLKFGLYHSLYEWFNPLYLSDKRSGFTQKNFIEKKLLPEMYELVNNYRPSVIWSDGDWEANDTYWNSKEFLAWLYNSSPVRDTVVVNDRWGKGIPCKHGDFYTCQDRFNPGVLQKHKWENAMTIDKTSWGFRRNARLSEYLTINDLIKTLAETVSCGGNMLINVGPTKEGMIMPIFQERLLQLGQWLNINGEAIYSSIPWTLQNDTLNKDVWYTWSPNNKALYGIVLQWPLRNMLELSSDFGMNIQYKNYTMTLLGENIPESLEYYLMVDKSVLVRFPDRINVKNDWAWVLKITHN